MKLHRWVDCYALRRHPSEGYYQKLHQVVNAFERFLGREASLQDLTAEQVNLWIMRRCGARSWHTARSRRGMLLTLWRAACEEGLVKEFPQRIRPVKTPPLIPQAWKEKELERLLDACQRLPGQMDSLGLPARDVWTAWVLLAWDTALRPCDLLNLTREHLRGGILLLVQKKTGFPLMCRLRPETLAAVDRLFPPEREKIFAFSRSQVDYWWEKIRQLSGLKGSTETIRRSRASFAEACLPGSAQRVLGHRTPGLCYKHYIDPTILYSPELPPPITNPRQRPKQEPPGEA